MTATRVPRSGFTTMAPRIEPRLPARRLGPQGEVGLLAVREVALVEQPHLLQHLAAGEHQRAVRVAGRLPSLGHGRRGEDAAEVRVDDRGGAVAEVGAGQARPAGAPPPPRACGPGSRAPARRRGAPAPPSRRRRGAGGRARAGTRRWRPARSRGCAGSSTSSTPAGQPGPHARQRLRRASRCRRRPPARRRRPSWARNRATVRHAPLGAVPVEDDDGQHARHPDGALGRGLAMRAARGRSACPWRRPASGRRCRAPGSSSSSTSASRTATRSWARSAVEAVHGDDERDAACLAEVDRREGVVEAAAVDQDDGADGAPGHLVPREAEAGLARRAEQVEHEAGVERDAAEVERDGGGDLRGHRAVVDARPTPRSWGPRS